MVKRSLKPSTAIKLPWVNNLSAITGRTWRPTSATAHRRNTPLAKVEGPVESCLTIRQTGRKEIACLTCFSTVKKGHLIPRKPLVAYGRLLASTIRDTSRATWSTSSCTRPLSHRMVRTTETTGAGLHRIMKTLAELKAC